MIPILGAPWTRRRSIDQKWRLHSTRRLALSLAACRARTLLCGGSVTVLQLSLSLAASDTDSQRTCKVRLSRLRDAGVASERGQGFVSTVDVESFSLLNSVFHACLVIRDLHRCWGPKPGRLSVFARRANPDAGGSGARAKNLKNESRLSISRTALKRSQCARPTRRSLYTTTEYVSHAWPDVLSRHLSGARASTALPKAPRRCVAPAPAFV